MFLQSRLVDHIRICGASGAKVKAIRVDFSSAPAFGQPGVIKRADQGRAATRAALKTVQRKAPSSFGKLVTLQVDQCGENSADDDGVDPVLVDRGELGHQRAGIDGQ